MSNLIAILEDYDEKCPKDTFSALIQYEDNVPLHGQSLLVSAPDTF